MWSDTNRAVQSQKMLETGNFGFRKWRNCTIRVAKTKALISFAVTAKLICAFIFTYADCWFSHAAAQMVPTRPAPDYMPHEELCVYKIDVTY